MESNGNTHIAVIPITADGHYQVSAHITDGAGNSTDTILFPEEVPNTFIIDNTKPQIKAEYDNNNALHDKYFNSYRTLTVTVEERNFAPDAMEISVVLTRPDGSSQLIPTGEWTTNGSLHSAVISCKADGDYSVIISGKDAAKNQSEPTEYLGKAVQNFTVDTILDLPQIIGVSNSSAYANAVIPKVEFMDLYLDQVKITLLRNRLNEVGVDVTDEMIADKAKWSKIPNGVTAILDIFPELQEYDGMYTLIAECSDYAGNTATQTVTFSVNRYGSVYIYGDELTSVMGAHLQEMDTDLILTEYNPSGLKSAKVFIMLNGTPITDPKYTVSPVPSGKVHPGESGWFEYQYVIDRSNFLADGQYTIVISTEDYAGNLPENTAEQMKIHFFIDKEAPAIVSITGMEKSIVNANSISVTVSLLDNAMLNKISVYANDVLIAEKEDLAEAKADFMFTIPEGYKQHIRIVATDAAGNVFDTDAEDYEPGFPFPEFITVSSNPFLRLYANKMVLIPVVVLFAAALAAIAFFVIKKTKKKV